MVETKQHTPEQPREIKEYLRTNENRNTIYPNLWRIPGMRKPGGLPSMGSHTV